MQKERVRKRVRDRERERGGERQRQRQRYAKLQTYIERKREWQTEGEKCLSNTNYSVCFSTEKIFFRS